MRKIQFSPGEYYHIFNHGVDERTVFPDEKDFMRFLVGMAIFNDEKTSPHNLNRFVSDPKCLIDIYSPDKRERLVDIITFTLLPTHYHFFVREKEKKGISRFMHRLDKGYARYFNLVRNRKGSLWQGTFEARHIDNEAYFTHIVSYVHLNILDLYFPLWREGRLEEREWSEAASKLADYPWSSYGYYRTGKGKVSFTKMILSLPEWLTDYYPGSEYFESSLRDWSSRFSDIAE